MSAPSPSLFFSVPQPAVTGLPHIITALDGELIAKVAHLTESTPGLWHLPAPYDENDVFDPWRDAEATKFSAWSLPANQAELMAPGRWAQEALFGTHAILLDSEVDEAAVIAVAQLRAERKDNGGFYQERFQDWPGLPRLLEITSWALLPVAPDRSHGLFVAAPGREEWVEKLRAFCERTGRSHCRVALQEGQAVVIDSPAPDDARERAAAQQIDMFLARMGRYFRLDDESLLPRLQRRIAAARQLNHAVAQAKNSPAKPA